MRTYRTEIPKAKPIEVIDSIKCDLCGSETHYTRFQHESSNWAEDPYGVDSTIIMREKGDVFPEGGSTETEFFDICGDCFENKLKPWLNSLGAKPQVRETDF